MLDKLRAIRATLNQIEVHGTGNLDRLLGCIQTLDGMITDIQEKEATGNAASDNG